MNNSELYQHIMEGNLQVVIDTLHPESEFLFRDGSCHTDAAAAYGHLDILKHLVSIGYDVQQNCCSALSLAANWGHAEVAKYLISCGCSPRINACRAMRNCIREEHFDVAVEIVDVNNDYIIRWCSDSKREVFLNRVRVAQKLLRWGI